MYDTILVPVDGSEPANRATEHAMDIASTFDADLHALYVVDTRRYGGVSDAGGVLEDLEESGRGILEDLETRADVEMTTEIRRGRPSEEIDAYADAIGADLIVLGNRGLAGPPGGEIGSVAERVVRYAGRPVITA
ncbi:universal stress protein [Natrialbaceae archaeon AArc-T1-2]|uniref:universal stress protein n=1 Tax=Natrialbaceae archaeon AArc-T1-2 TaxID=3053904 RepID=UPI00255A9224|nr:universal stress protein [Natrialbaceae archaeon AArc-T1-2]WIV68355.1 universal stress protein [Natrialbaceae archaeon AArc-T1-2]